MKIETVLLEARSIFRNGTRHEVVVGSGVGYSGDWGSGSRLSSGLLGDVVHAREAKDTPAKTTVAGSPPIKQTSSQIPVAGQPGSATDIKDRGASEAYSQLIKWTRS